MAALPFSLSSSVVGLVAFSVAMLTTHTLKPHPSVASKHTAQRSKYFGPCSSGREPGWVRVLGVAGSEPRRWRRAVRLAGGVMGWWL